MLKIKHKLMVGKKGEKSQVEKGRTPKDPFEIEDLRTKFSSNKDYRNFKKTYSSKYPEIKAPNTDAFWNEKFKTPVNFPELDPMTKDKIDTIISFFPAKQIKILDLGIGQGYLEQRLNEIGIKYQLFGIDISEKAIMRARRKFKGEFRVGNVLKVKNYYKSDHFDVIVAIELIEHISPRKIFTFYKNVYNLLKPGGILIVSTPLNEGVRYMNENPSSHVREYTESILRAEFEISGFKIIDERFFFAFRNFYRFKNLLSKIFKNRWGANNIVIKAIKT